VAKTVLAIAVRPVMTELGVTVAEIKRWEKGESRVGLDVVRLAAIVRRVS
jgi:hypothetical protein